MSGFVRDRKNFCLRLSNQAERDLGVNGGDSSDTSPFESILTKGSCERRRATVWATAAAAAIVELVG